MILLQPQGERILSLIGKRTADQAAAQGILLPQQMPAARAALQAAIAQEEAEHAQAVALAQAEGRRAPLAPAVSLRQRAHPLLKMMDACAAADVPIVWGV